MLNHFKHWTCEVPVHATRVYATMLLNAHNGHAITNVTKADAKYLRRLVNIHFIFFASYVCFILFIVSCLVTIGILTFISYRLRWRIRSLASKCSHHSLLEISWPSKKFREHTVCNLALAAT